MLSAVDTDRIGDWIQTYSGGCFWPLDPRPSEVQITDIAHALSMQCRYAGHVERFYSVAEHSVLVSHAVPAEHALWSLLHDAAEAYSADIPRPLKRYLRDWKSLEARIMRAVCERFGLNVNEPDCVSQADLAITSDERAALMAPCMRENSGELPPALGLTVIGLSPIRAEMAFLERFQDLMAD